MPYTIQPLFGRDHSEQGLYSFNYSFDSIFSSAKCDIQNHHQHKTERKCDGVDVGMFAFGHFRNQSLHRFEPPPPKCIRIMEGDSWDCDPTTTSLPGYPGSSCRSLFRDYLSGIQYSQSFVTDIDRRINIPVMMRSA